LFSRSRKGWLIWGDFQIGPQNDYGLKAHQDLIVTRGAGFRKEKNKKKKGSYRGGEITVRVLLTVALAKTDWYPVDDFP
jgi:hypothetical protein